MIGEILEEILKSNKVKIKDFSDKCMVSNAQMSQILNGKCALSLRVFKEFLKNAPKGQIQDDGMDLYQWQLNRAYCEYLALTPRKVKKAELYWWFENSRKYITDRNDWHEMTDLVLLNYINDKNINTVGMLGEINASN